MEKKDYVITSETGIHARPATMLVQSASKFESDIELAFDGKSVNLKSIMGVMSLGAGEGSEVSIVVDGSDEEQAISAIEETLVNEGLVTVE